MGFFFVATGGERERERERENNAGCFVWVFIVRDYGRVGFMSFSRVLALNALNVAEGAKLTRGAALTLQCDAAWGALWSLNIAVLPKKVY